MFTLFRRVRLGQMLRISHRMGDVDCSLAALEQAHPMGDPAQLSIRLNEYAADRRLQWVLPEETQNDRVTGIMRLVSSNIAFFLAVFTADGGGELAQLAMLASFTLWVLSLVNLLDHNRSQKGRSCTMAAAETEVWLMQNAPEARMLHVRRALHMLISYSHHFMVTQDRRFNELLHDCISLYLYLLRYAIEHPNVSEMVQGYVSNQLPMLVTTVLNTRMHSSDQETLTKYGTACRTVMGNQLHAGGRFIWKVQEAERMGCVNAHGMKRHFRVMRESFIHDGLIDEGSAEEFAPQRSVNAKF